MSTTCLRMAVGCLGSLLLLCGAVQAAEQRNLAVAANPAASERRVALVIGNAAYQQGALANPVNDARAMSSRLRSLGFDVTLKENLKQREIGGVYREFRSKISPGAIALVFYAGHGVQVRGQNYFPAVDSDISSEEDVPLHSLNLGTLLDNMEEAKAGVSLVFLDACRDNPFARRFRSTSRGLTKIEAASGTLIHYATKPGSVAADGDGQNGTYTEALLAQIGEPGVPVEIMLKNVTNRVVDKTKGKQEPWIEGSLRGDFYFIFNGPTTVQVQPAPADPEAITWEAAEAANTAASYQVYLDAYPRGRYIAAARIKLADLKKPAAPAQPPASAVPAAPTFAQASSDPETAFWNEVKASGTRDYYEVYLKQYPKGKFQALAKLELKKLDDWEKAQAARDEAERKLVEERAKQEAIRIEQAAREADQRAWESAQRSDTEAAYRQYQTNHPQGRYLAPAQTRLKELETDEAYRSETDHWQRARSAEDSATVQGYLDRYPSGRYVAPAQTKLAAVKKEEAELRPGKVFKDCAECPEMVVLPAGSFDMGSDKESEEQPLHRVTLKSFAMGKTEVTQGQWKALMGNNPSGHDDCGENCPVESVNWNDVQEYVKKLRQQTGKTYRLPSEAEWEYACRAGRRQAYCGSDNTEVVAWYGKPFVGGNSGGRSHPVGGLQANAWGLYDMSGNVWEWVEDCWHDNYAGAPTDGSAWIGGDCGKRVLRGGSRGLSAQYVRSAVRYGGWTLRIPAYGFRLARMLP